ncbi:MazG family protein [Chloroherpeton thalassium ATCC 35110]|uniref:Nucleoside triphosphate pyrophosphohydrolase n=1 Tax=Chloroherpeton thalassium (strain ATCC 35110 / GB-78) TaxID=517418 RepID=B3QV77_CHLT3|nr:nucleoside triphosphate pyrophosphohydrolase [Chloroherpeton thalassium]ACF13031.1 MazG family protein [Chloroherpeton thalassium ATCC 35110]
MPDSNAQPNEKNIELKEKLQHHVPKATGEKFERLVSIIGVLREECPWDKKQTPESLVPLTLEETYELAHAVDAGDDVEMKKELGDILLHICFQALLGNERKAFNIGDVLDAIAEKLIFRHPHVFGTAQAETEEAVKKSWEKLKMKEGRKSVLGGVPNAMPELLRSYRVQEKAAGVGFDWDNAEGVWAKVLEELDELKAAKTPKEKEDELGDLLFSIVNYSRFLKTNPEDALRKSTEKFMARFLKVETQVAASGKSWQAYSLEELDVFWDQAKKEVQ